MLRSVNIVLPSEIWLQVRNNHFFNIRNNEKLIINPCNDSVLHVCTLQKPQHKHQDLLTSCCVEAQSTLSPSVLTQNGHNPPAMASEEKIRATPIPIPSQEQGGQLDPNFLNPLLLSLHHAGPSPCSHLWRDAAASKVQQLSVTV